MCEGGGNFLLPMRRCGLQVLTGRGLRGGGGLHGAHRGPSWAARQRKWPVDELQWQRWSIFDDKAFRKQIREARGGERCVSNRRGWCSLL
jgi:hypothetical protein